MEHIKVGFAFCGSFCTYSMAMTALERVKARFGDVTPIISESAAANDTRFGPAHEFMREMERICDKRVIDTLVKAEPIGPKKLLDVLVICPATNDGLAASARNIGTLLDRKHVYFVPFRQDDPAGKPTSLVADFSLVPDAIAAALEGRQLQPLLLGSPA